VNKAQLIENVARALGVSKASVERTVNELLEEVRKAVGRGKTVSLSGFGTFRLRTRKARPGRNPQTGKRIRLKATRFVSFRAGRPFREAL
jgi:DNA-binding protein HU-beta